MSFFSKFKLTACEVGPNYQIDDAFVALVSMLNIFGWKNKQNQDYCQNWFKEYLALPRDQKIYFTDNGRTGLYLLLKSLNLPKNSEILIQPFSCVVLPNAIWQSNYKPVLVDVDPQTYNMDIKDLQKKLTKNTKVLILQYTFGSTAGASEIIEFCKKNNLILIEDCAHSLGQNVFLDNKKWKVGTLGQASFFSFGRDKVISTTIGGMTTINEKSYLPKINSHEKWKLETEKEFEKLPKISLKRVIQALYYPISTTFFIRPFYYIHLGKAILMISRKLKLIGEIYTKKETLGTSEIETNSKYSTHLFGLLKNQLQKFEKLQNHRKKLMDIYASELKVANFDGSLIRFPVDLENLIPNYKAKYNQILTSLKNIKVLAGQWYTSLFMQNKMNYEALFDYKKGDLKNAEDLVDQRIINLPTNINTTPEKALEITKAIKIQLNQNLGTTV